MTSDGNNFNYFSENQLTKFSAVLWFKHSKKMSCFAGQYSLHIKRNLLYWNGSGSAQEDCLVI